MCPTVVTSDKSLFYFSSICCDFSTRENPQFPITMNIAKSTCSNERKAITVIERDILRLFCKPFISPPFVLTSSQLRTYFPSPISAPVHDPWPISPATPSVPEIPLARSSA